MLRIRLPRSTPLSGGRGKNEELSQLVLENFGGLGVHEVQPQLVDDLDFLVLPFAPAVLTDVEDYLGSQVAGQRGLSC